MPEAPAPLYRIQHGEHWIRTHDGKPRCVREGDTTTLAPEFVKSLTEVPPVSADYNRLREAQSLPKLEKYQPAAVLAAPAPAPIPPKPLHAAVDEEE